MSILRVSTTKSLQLHSQTKIKHHKSKIWVTLVICKSRCLCCWCLRPRAHPYFSSTPSSRDQGAGKAC